MKATDFEYRHQLLLHELIVGAAVLTYLFDRDDIVWRFIKSSGANARFLERSVFAVATLLFGISAWICTRARAYQGVERTRQPAALATDRPFRFRDHRLYLGEYLFAVALVSLLPLAGFCILAMGEAIRLFRLYWRDRASDIVPVAVMPSTREQARPAKIFKPEWAKALRREAIKWGLFLTMIVFTATLKDRVGEALICVTILLWVLLNLRLSLGPREVALR